MLKLYKRNPKKLAQIALDNELFVQGWSLEMELWRITQSYKAKVVLAYIDNIPVGVCTRKEDGHISAYVKPNYRRRGIGRKMVKRIQESITDYGLSGVAGSMNFWSEVLEKNEIQRKRKSQETMSTV